jgi:hypothetical protein
MEVHHHAHSPRKKWTHYFWEFLMLFLAVFCGFFAEYQLEHKIEKERGKQYILSFSEDLKTDTAQFNLLIKELTEQQSVLENIVSCFDTVTRKANSTECLKAIIINSIGFTDYIYTDRTIQQLKYAGGLRLIEDKEIADSIVKYDALVRQEQIHQQVMENMQQVAINAHNSMIGFRQLLSLKKYGTGTNLFLLSNNSRDINNYFNEIYTFQKACRGQLVWMQQLKNMATRILFFLNEKHY